MDIASRLLQLPQLRGFASSSTFLTPDVLEYVVKASNLEDLALCCYDRNRWIAPAIPQGSLPCLKTLTLEQGCILIQHCHHIVEGVDHSRSSFFKSMSNLSIKKRQKFFLHFMTRTHMKEVRNWVSLVRLRPAKARVFRGEEGVLRNLRA